MFESVFYVVAALGGAALWGIWPALVKGNTGDQLIQQGIGSAIFSLGLAAIISPVLSIGTVALGLAAGALWAIAYVGGETGIERIGIAKSSALWATGTIVTMAMSVLIFQEFGRQLALGVAGVLVLVSGASLVSLSGERKQEGRKMREHTAFGFACALFAAIFWGIYPIPLKLANPIESLVPLSFGILAIGLGKKAIEWLACKTKDRGKFGVENLFTGTTLAGFIWAAGNALVVLAAMNIGTAKAFALAQVSVVLTAFIGIFYFKEAISKKAVAMMLAGAVLAVIGSAMLAVI